MTDIFCPTCGRPNPDDQNLCEFCGSPLGVEELSRLDNLVSPEEPEDELSRLDKLIPQEEEDQPATDESARLEDYLTDQESQDQVSEETSPADEFSYDEKGADEEEILDSLRSEDLSTREEPSRLDDIFSDMEKREEPSELDELLSPPADADQASSLDEFLSDGEQTGESTDFDAYFSAVEGSEEPSLLDDILSKTDEPIQHLESAQFYEPEDQQERQMDSDDVYSEEEEPEQPYIVDEFLSAEDKILPEDDSYQTAETEPFGESIEDYFAETINLPQDFSEQDLPGDPAEDKKERDLIQDDDFGTSPPGDWFSGEETQAEELASPTEPLDDLDPGPMSPGFGEDSSWLEMLQGPEQTPSAPDDQAVQPAAPSPPVDKKDTDWLERIKRLNKSADVVDDDSSFPDWLTVTEKASQKGEEEKTSVEPAAPAEDVPDWLQLDENDEQLGEFLKKKDLIDEEYQPETPQEKIVQDTPQQKPEKGKGASKKFPSWASDEDSAALEEDQEIPEELRFLAGLDPSSTGGKTVDPFQAEDGFFDDLFSDELPNWLESAAGEGISLVDDGELTVGELPGWVEAMRPVVESTDATGLEDDEEYIENFGPLAGIPSVLPAEADIVIDPEKAGQKPLDLTASKNHQEYVSVLKKLIEAESKTPEIIKRAPVQTQRILRWLISIILLVTTAGTVIFGGSYQAQRLEDRQLINTGYAALYNQISKLGPGQPVLVAFDYQPAATGELHTAASSVVDHLMEQGTYLSFISTQPTGPALAEHFLITTQQKHQYQHSQQYVNLGYLPGESAGLVSFLIAPKQIIPLAFNGSNAWGSPPLINVKGIEDFKMILVITDDPNTAKIWIEQIGPNLNTTQLNMVVSAQVEPLIQPYFRSSPQLLSGYVAGVTGSMKYEGLYNEPNLATATWLPYNIGIIVSVGTIFIGGLANGVLSLFSRHRKEKLGEIK